MDMMTSSKGLLTLNVYLNYWSVHQFEGFGECRRDIVSLLSLVHVGVKDLTSLASFIGFFKTYSIFRGHFQGLFPNLMLDIFAAGPKELARSITKQPGNEASEKLVCPTITLAHQQCSCHLNRFLELLMLQL